MSIPVDGTAWIWHNTNTAPDSGAKFDHNPTIYMRISATKTIVSGGVKIDVSWASDIYSGSVYNYPVTIGLYHNGSWVGDTDTFNHGGSVDSNGNVTVAGKDKSGSFSATIKGNYGKPVYLALQANCSGCGAGTRLYKMWDNAKVSGSPSAPSNRPSISPNPIEVLVGNNTTFSLTKRGDQTQIAYRDCDENGAWNWSGTWADNASWSDTKETTVTRSLTRNRSQTGARLRSRNIDERYTNKYSSWVYSDSFPNDDSKAVIYAKAKLRPATAVAFNKTSSTDPLLYNESISNITYTNHGKNPTSNINVSNDPPPRYLGGSASNPPLYDNETYVQVKLKHSYFIESDWSSNTEPKARVKLRQPTSKPILNATNYYSPEYDIVTIGNKVKASGSHGYPIPTSPAPVLNYQWQQGTTNIGTGDTCQIRNNFYHVYTYDTWESNGHSLLRSAYSDPSKVVLTRRCPRGMTTDNTFKNNFKFGAGKTSSTVKYDYFTDSTTPRTAEGHIILTLDNNLYVKFPAYSADKNLGKFNCYKIEFINPKTGAVITSSSIYSNNSENANSGTMVFNLLEAVQSGAIVPGTEYNIRFKAGYMKDNSLDDGTYKIYWWDPTEINPTDISEGEYADTNVFYTNYSNGSSSSPIPVLIGGQPEPPELLYPASTTGTAYGTYNEHPRIIFKIYNPDYLNDIPNSELTDITVTVTIDGSTTSYQGIIAIDADTGLSYFSSGSSAQFTLINPDIGYPNWIVDKNNNNMTTAEVVDGKIVYNKLGKNFTKGYVVVFNIPQLSANAQISIECKNKFNVTSEHTFILRKLTFENGTTQGDTINAVSDKLDPIDIGNQLLLIVDSYKNFVSKDTSQELKQIIEHTAQYTQSELQNKKIEPNTISDTSNFLYSWQKALRQIHSSVYRKCYATPYLEHTILDKPDPATVSVNRSLYNNAICNLIGVRRFECRNNKWYQVTLRDDPETAFEIDNLAKYGLTVSGFTNGTGFTIRTAYKYAIDLGRIYPVNSVKNSEATHKDTLNPPRTTKLDPDDPASYDLYAYYAEGTGYRGSLLDLVADLLRTLI